MTPYSEPIVLQDQTRWHEIFLLRCKAWENSPFPNSINFKKYPDGFSDLLDERSIHFVSFNSDNEIIATARLTVLEDFKELPYPKIFRAQNHWPDDRPFLFYSRLVIQPHYRKLGLKEKLDQVRIQYQRDHQIAFSVATATEARAKELAHYGFQSLAIVSKDLDSLFPFEHRELLLLLLLLLLSDIKIENQSKINTSYESTN